MKRDELNFFFQKTGVQIVQCLVTKNQHSEMDVEKRLRLVCNFCNAILLSKKEATKDAFTRHLEESHNIVQNADDVLILHCLSDEDKATLKKKKRASLEDVFGLVIERDEEDVDDQKKIFNYPRLKKNPKEKYSEFVRRKLSTYLKVQGFGRGGVQYGQGKEPHGWPTKSYSWKSFKGTARGCSMKMAEEIISAMLSAQDTNPEDLIDDGSGTDSNEDVGEDSDDTTQCETSPDIKETTKKSHLLKNLKSALNLLSERALPEENGESNDERSESVSTSSGRPNWPPASIIEDFKSALVSCLPKESKMTATEIHSKLDDDHFPLSTTIKCLSILANEGVIIWENLIVSWPSTPEKEPAIPQMQIQDDLPEPGAQSVSEKVFQTSKKARKRPMAALEPRGKSERKKKTPLRLLD